MTNASSVIHMGTTTNSKPGRRKSVLRLAESLIGCASIAALRTHDLHIISGADLLRLRADLEKITAGIAAGLPDPGWIDGSVYNKETGGYTKIATNQTPNRETTEVESLNSIGVDETPLCAE